MKSKVVSGIMLTSLLICMLTLTLNVQPVKAEPRTWTVDDDRADCPDADFTSIQEAINAASPGDTIYVYNGIYYEHLFVNKDDLTIIGENKINTIIDGMGFGAVIKVWMNKVTMSGFTVRNGSRDGGWWYHQGSGIYLSRTTRSCNISNNLISNIRFGIALMDSTNNTINSNVISDVEEGISFDRGNYNTIESNLISDVDIGIGLWNSNNNTIIGNTVSNTYLGISFGGAFSDYNTVSGNSISNCTEIGIFFDGDVPSYYNTVSDNSISNVGNGVYFNYPYYNTVSGNTISDGFYGIHFQMGGSNNTVTDNTISDCAYGIRTDYADKNFVSENTVSNSYMAIAIGYESSFSTVSGNIASESDMGIVIMDSSNNNTVVGNVVSNNAYGIALLWQSNNTKIYHNNFINNTDPVLLIQSFNTAWDDGYPSGGNYWSDYTAKYSSVVDEYHGENQDIPGDDGIWDHPYVIDADDQDRFPLTESWSPLPTTLPELRDMIDQFSSQGLIDNSQGLANSLISKVDAASSKLKTRTTVATNILNSLINEVQAQAGKHIEKKSIETLIKATENVINHL